MCSDHCGGIHREKVISSEIGYEIPVLVSETRRELVRFPAAYRSPVLERTKKAVSYEAAVRDNLSQRRVPGR